LSAPKFFTDEVCDQKSLKSTDLYDKRQVPFTESMPLVQNNSVAEFFFFFHSYTPVTATFSANLCVSRSIFLVLQKFPDFFQEYTNSWVSEEVVIPNFKELLSSTLQKKMKTCKSGLHHPISTSV